MFALAPCLSATVLFQSDPSSNFDYINRVEANASSVYVLGQVNSIQAGRVEKRDPATGALDPGFATSGVLDLSQTTTLANYYLLSLQGSRLYWGSYGANPPGATNTVITLGCVDAATGLPVGSFGSGGILQFSVPLWTFALGLTADSSGLYLCGEQGISSDTALWIQKRHLNTGALMPAFGTGGEVLDNASSSADGYRSLYSNGSTLIAAGYVGSTSTATSGLLAAYDASTGALVTGFGASGKVLDPTVPLYTSVQGSGAAILSLGVSSTIGTLQRRALATGALDSQFGGSGSVSFSAGTTYGAYYDLRVLQGLAIVDGSANTGASAVAFCTAYDAVSGAVQTSFGSGGTLTSAPGTLINLQPLGFAANEVYWAGSDGGGSAGQWRVEKFSVPMLPTATPTPSTSTTPPASLRQGKLYNYPNPLRPGGGRFTTLRFLPTSNAKLEFYDMAGRKVGELDSSKINGSAGTAVWDGRLYNDAIAAPGLYMVLLRGDNGILSAKLTVIR